MSGRELMDFTKALAGITLESLTEILKATGHEDAKGFVGGLLHRAAEQATDDAISAQVFEDPPPFNR
ncbi:hypothetical protein [Streptomyces lincolnensis]|uniref:hypothetical protein n=1 Tax=Streptomyces lincolnensis TaxID=1915 RepID=UPI0037CF5BAE